MDFVVPLVPSKRFKRSGALIPLLSILLSVGVTTSAASAKLSLPSIFADHAVLQRSPSTPVWGQAPPGTKVVVELSDVSAATEADAEGRWSVVLDLESLGAGPFQLRVAAGDATVTLNDILIGEVWLASGQSNMAWPLAKTLRAEQEIATSANNSIRQFIVESTAEPRRSEIIRGKWSIADPATTGSFSAVGYYFAKDLHLALGVPVAILNVTWGASSIEAWTSADALASVPSLKSAAEKQLQQIEAYPSALKQYEQDLTKWFEDTQRTDKRTTEGITFPADSSLEWREVAPGKLPKTPSEPGAVWFRNRVVIADSEVEKSGFIRVGNVQGADEIYLNGTRLKAAQGKQSPLDRPQESIQYRIPEDLLHTGENTIAIRVFSPVLPPQLEVNNTRISFSANHRAISSGWEVAREFSLPPPTEAEVRAIPSPPEPPATPNKRASQLFNGMINPLAPYRIAGVIWYQGESNVVRAEEYRTAFPLLINDWRDLWKRADLPFYWCQIAALEKKSSSPVDSNRAELRDAQTGALSLPQTGQAITFDVGEADDIHPREKEVVGKRVAALALARTYGRDVADGGPQFDSLVLEESRAILRFSNTAGGLIAAPLPDEYPLSTMPPVQEELVRNSPNSELEGFAIRGDDGKWHWADARIAGDTVVVSSPAVANPVEVRYAWASNPTGNLFGKNGFPAPPFRATTSVASTPAPEAPPSQP